jgi:hypothetical protein
MASQTLIFVVLPNGITRRKTLSASIYLTWRLEKGATLAAFPDVLNWPELVQKDGLTFDLACGSKKASVPAVKAVLRPDAWKQIFTAQTFVEAYTIPNYDERLIVSYPVREALLYLKYAYQAIGTQRGPDQDVRGLRVVLQDLMFRHGQDSTLDAGVSQMRVQMWHEQHGGIGTGSTGISAFTKAEMLTVPPDGIPTTLSAPTNTRDMITRFALFHHLPPARHGPPLPKTAADFAKVLDFHRAITALSSYPSLMRALGLVFDVELPGAFCANSPAGGTYATISVAKVNPGFKWALVPKFSFPSTSYWRDAVSFSAAPATPAASVTSHNYVAGDVVNGFLALTPDNFNLSQVDVDGALLKAMTLADNVSNADSSVVGDALPALRSAGIALIASGRGMQLLQSIRDNKGFNEALTANGPFPRPFAARDLTRGFRVDIWSSRTGHWHSLHRRDASYKLGATGMVEIHVADEEGFLQPGAAQPAPDPKRRPDPIATRNHIPQRGTDLYLLERVFGWQGWSLSVKRPGGALNRNADPAVATTPDPTTNQPVTPFKMTTSFVVTAGSLPELRFGDRYRVRARGVDLAGNSVPLQAAKPGPFALPANGVELPYLRFEPVSPPILVLQQRPRLGGSLEYMVIRSENSDTALDTIRTNDSDQRHVAPPRVSARMAEQHGMLDGTQGKLRGDPATYHMIVTRDKYEFPKQNGVPLEPGPNLAVSYLPDPLARGAAFAGLPNTVDDTSGRVSNNSLRYTTLPDVQPSPGSVTYIDFGAQWPARMAFRVVLVEGTTAPQFDAAQRVLTVSLPKGALVTVNLSSYISESDLTVLGVWDWLREYFEAAEASVMQSGDAGTLLTNVSDIVALLTRLVLQGGHEMLTPSRTLTLVHAVQQPLRRPNFVQLPVVHQPADPIFASALRNSFTPITAWRSVDSHYAVLLGGLLIHGQSTSKVDLEGRFREVADDPLLPKPTRVWHSDHVETIELATTEPGPIYSNATSTRMVAIYMPKVDTLWFSAPFDKLEGVTTQSAVAAPLHRFNDTKHRWVSYVAVATSRFQEYFLPGLDFTRSSNRLMVDVPSSARPIAPDVAYVVPTFGWERQESSNVKSSVRFGNGFRVYLQRPWYSSGEDELLGVLLWTGAPPDSDARETYKPFFTQWGNDPIWEAGSLDTVPGMADFSNAAATATQLTLEETSLVVDVAGHEVVFDQERGLWYCDIEFYNATAYAPFVRLALARYQPHSIQGVELSRVVLADYAQLTPDRSTVVSIDPADPRRARVFVGGLAPQTPEQSLITVSIERRISTIQTDLGWEEAPPNVVNVTEDTPAPTDPAAVLWSGTILFAKVPPKGQFRVVIREYERIPVDSPPGEVMLGERLVYAATVAYDYPSAQS